MFWLNHLTAIYMQEHGWQAGGAGDRVTAWQFDVWRYQLEIAQAAFDKASMNDKELSHNFAQNRDVQKA